MPVVTFRGEMKSSHKTDTFYDFVVADLNKGYYEDNGPKPCSTEWKTQH
jgi:hypothetical protein